MKKKSIDRIVADLRDYLTGGIAPRCEMPESGSKSATQNAIGILRGGGKIIAMRADGCGQYIYMLPDNAEMRPLSEDMQRVCSLIKSNGGLSGADIKRKLRGGSSSTIPNIVAGLVARKMIRFEDGKWMIGEPEFRALPAVEEKGGDYVSERGWYGKAYNK